MDIIKVGGYILKMTSDRYKLFIEYNDFEENISPKFLGLRSRIGGSSSFVEPVPEFDWSRNIPIICFISNENNLITHIAKGKKGQRAGTELRKLNLKNIHKIETPISLSEIKDKIPKRVKANLINRIKGGGLLPHKTSEYFVDVLITLSPETEGILVKYSRTHRLRLGRLTEEVRDALAKQKEALATALSIAGIDREPLQEWYLKEDSTPSSFLDGLPQARLLEDQMIVKDLSTIPGYNLVKTTPHASAIFTDNLGNRLTVILANRLPLEKQLGTDLIYYNEDFHAFVMVQYKAMEIDNYEAYFRFPEKQLDAEISRMENALKELGKCAKDTHHHGFRFNSNPFFLKFCPRIGFHPDDKGLVKGIYIHLDHWSLLKEASELTGPKGGKKITYKNVGRYLDNTAFINLVSQAWVGTTITQSKILETVIKDTLAHGKAVAIAVKSASFKYDKTVSDDNDTKIFPKEFS